MKHALHATVLLAGLLALAACAPGGSTRDCALSAPPALSRATIEAMTPGERRAELKRREEWGAVCHG